LIGKEKKMADMLRHLLHMTDAEREAWAQNLRRESNAEKFAMETYQLLREISDNGTVTRDLQTKLDELLNKIECGK
jgi:hypothetical protein